MLHHNHTDKPLRFSIAGLDYRVPPGGEVEIPDPFVYVVKSRGMTELRPGPAPKRAVPAPVASVAAVTPPAPVHQQGVTSETLTAAAVTRLLETPLVEDIDEDIDTGDPLTPEEKAIDEAAGGSVTAKTLAALASQGIVAPGIAKRKSGRRR